jgi:hypothetical protein
MRFATGSIYRHYRHIFKNSLGNRRLILIAAADYEAATGTAAQKSPSLAIFLLGILRRYYVVKYPPKALCTPPSVSARPHSNCRSLFAEGRNAKLKIPCAVTHTVAVVFAVQLLVTIYFLL